MKILVTGAFITLLLAGCGQGESNAPASTPARNAPATQSGVTARSQIAAAASAAMPSETRAFRDWRAVCDNGNACVAFTGTDGTAGWLMVSLDGGPDARPSVTVGMWPSSGDGLTTPVTVTIDGRRFRAAPEAKGSGSAAIAPSDTATVIAALASGRSLTLTLAGEEPAVLSVSGASASLLWIDERQGRLDTPAALIRKGARSAALIPAPPTLPLIPVAPAVSQAGFTGPLDPITDDGVSPKLPTALLGLPAVVECRANLDFNPDIRKLVTASRLDASTELWGVPCGAGAYNFNYRYFLTGANGADPRAISFPTSGETEVELTNSAYDPVTRTLAAFAKGRGIGDCGVAQQWVWSGRAFVLKTEAVMGECWGVASDHWPTTYRSR